VKRSIDAAGNAASGHKMFIAAGSDFSGGKVKRKRGSYAALGKMRLDKRGKNAALKMKTPHSYSEVPCWKLVNNSTLTVVVHDSCCLLRTIL